jgi:hypothetical protein
LETAEQAARAGLEESALVAARDRSVVVVHINQDGGFGVEPKEMA